MGKMKYSEKMFLALYWWLGDGKPVQSIRCDNITEALSVYLQIIENLENKFFTDDKKETDEKDIDLDTDFGRRD